ncbi:39S ribosomal protein L50, mitochondrial [Armadillidium nasatum]|uniref:Large ribosomal subunit protein mL50 n=1 Tax=Armadillidium nasatum TaxID=96803 RepID=A0A5N5SKC9_9CRUS|nr:39S ribosomal protein L50, mitochondrial [Armadillidium nasatum]
MNIISENCHLHNIFLLPNISVNYSLKRLIGYVYVYVQQAFSTKSSNIDDDDDYDLAPNKKFDSICQSMSHRGYLRAQKPYTPPVNASSLITEICEKCNVEKSGTLSDREIKFNVLKECAKEFDHTVPNYMLHNITSVDDIFQFYQTPVSTIFPLEEMKHMELPKNLHVLYDYVRFHPETDTKFGGISAFPESSTIVSNLKSKKKYHGYKAKVKSLGK